MTPGLKHFGNSLTESRSTFKAISHTALTVVLVKGVRPLPNGDSSPCLQKIHNCRAIVFFQMYNKQRISKKYCRHIQKRARIVEKLQYVKVVSNKKDRGLRCKQLYARSIFDCGSENSIKVRQKGHALRMSYCAVHH